MALSKRMRVIGVAAGGLAVVVWMAAGVVNVSSVAAQAGGAWTQVDQEFRGRAALVPEIVTVVRAVNPAQQDLVDDLQRAQAAVLALKADPAAPGDAGRFAAFKKTQDDLSVALGRVMDLVNLYPDRRREPAIRAVLDKLERIENRIVVARSDYRGTAQRYNAAVTGVPGRWLAAFVQPDAKPLIPGFEQVAAN